MIARSLTVAVGVEQAFETWTQRIDLWWPPSHRAQPRTLSHITMEGRVGGQLVERSASGEVLRLFGTVTGWDPPGRLAYDFYMGGTQDRPTEVEIRFSASDGGTRVNVEHRQGRMSKERWGRTNRGFDRAWTDVTAAFATFTDTYEDRA